MSEKSMLVNYDHDIQYNNDPLNVVGANKHLTLRTVTAYNDANCKHVRKFGLDYEITDVTDIEDPIDVNMIFRVYSLDGTLLGSRTGGGAFVDGAVVTAQGCYLEIEASGGAVTVLAGIDITTDIDVGGKTFVCPAETIADGDTLRLYLSDTTSTYYDSAYMYGGARHTPDGTADLPYFHPETADAALGGAHTIVTVLDSAIYESDSYAISGASTVWQSALGQTPTITSGVGARVTREVSTQYNNLTAVYYNKNGNDANPGTWQNPFLTATAAIAGRGGLDVIYGGAEAEFTTNYIENITVNAFIFEADYGYLISFQTATITIAGATGTIHGIIFDGQNIDVGIELTGTSHEVYDCTFYNFSKGSINSEGNVTTLIIKRCISHDNLRGFRLLVVNTPATFTLENNIIYNNTSGISMQSGGVAHVLTLNTLNNIIYSNESGLYIEDNVGGGADFTVNGDIDNDLFFNNNNGAQFNELNSLTINATIDNAIFKNNTVYGILSDVAVTINYCNFDENGTDYSGTVTSNNEIAGDPKLCKITSPYEFGLSADSPCYRADAGGDDIGPLLRIIEINESDIIINGFIIDGQKQYNNAVFILDTVDHTGNINKWCTIENFQGIAGDPYDNNTNTDCQYLNCIIRNNGNGVKFSYGGNTIRECIFYRNTIFNIHSDYTTQTFNHNVLYGGQYGLYLESNSAGTIFKNNITAQNSLYGIFSEVGIAINHCCIQDSYNSNVDLSDSSNFTLEPLFINTDVDEENFNIKTIENLNEYDSPCKDSSDDDPVNDIGAYLMDRSVDSDTWKLYPLEFNPKVEWSNVGAGYTTNQNALGAKDNYARNFKRRFSMTFGDLQQVSSEVLRQKIEYFATLIKSRTRDWVEEQTKFRVHLKGVNNLIDPTAGVIDSSAQTIDDVTADWTEDQFRGFHVGIQWEAGTNMVIDSILKTGSIMGGWTADDWIGYYYHLNNYYYYIADNNIFQLILSDPNDTLIAETVDWNIEKYFKILSNSQNQLYVEDPKGELPDGTYDYYIDFIECKAFTSQFTYQQKLYDYEKEYSKTGYQIIFEEL